MLLVPLGCSLVPFECPAPSVEVTGVRESCNIFCDLLFKGIEIDVKQLELYCELQTEYLALIYLYL